MTPISRRGRGSHVHTEHNTLFRVINHVRDLGHFLILGATGAGKSTFGNFLRAQWMQYPRRAGQSV